MGRPDKYEHNYPSVTEIVDLACRPDLNWWYGKNGWAHCERVKKESQEIGHGVHAAIERYVKGDPFSKAAEGLSDQQKLMLSPLASWVEDEKVIFDSTEETLYDNENKFAGTYDGTARIKTVPWIVDWKTDSTPDTKAHDRDREFKYKLQAAGYSILLKADRNIDIPRAKVVRSSKKYEFKVYTFEDLTLYKRLFLNLREVYKEYKGK